MTMNGRTSRWAQFLHAIDGTRRSLGLALATVLLAGSVLTPAVAMALDSSAAHYQRSYELERKRQYKQALNALGRIGQPERGSYVFAVRKAWLLYLSRRSKDALKWYAVAQKLTPTSLEAPLGRILVLNATRKWSQSAKEADALLRRYPNNRIALTRLAWARFNQGRFPAAAKAYQQVLALYPADLSMRAGLGWSQLRMGQPKKAAKSFALVLRVAPHHRSARDGALRAESAMGGGR